ncbi:1-aminocyclopropane-1-carboxylate deaminase/D-cysteine desulfhydrase [Effusibacillus lacus]|uniref:D-cysteine desulfhydrase n=1 Tax=Effusibacillus lacus TaxID=1348429 RepID=A0A292YQ98_9BACL|nr:D-cysteine desulfhydrase family protein [Effusibacillus lacus]TCS72498.1 D-cysteine desulfhydrase [Effusibacillus lacus]GAX90933.1 D-cysteine desulfhydrase [Effusibacillus lacus]
MSGSPVPAPLSLAAVPTPMHRLHRLSEAFGTEVWIKRDDMTGDMATAGNKIRKLEYLLADALQKGADCVVTTGGPQSNHTRAVTALAVRLGMESVIVAAGRDPGTRRANLLMNELMGARILFSETYSPADQEAALLRTCRELAAQGRKPYLIPVGGSNGLGTLGYIRAYEEMSRQREDGGLQFDWIFVTVGSGGTYAGLLLGQYLTSSKQTQPEKIVGISTWLNRNDSIRLVASCLTEAADWIGGSPPVSPYIEDSYLGKGYGVPTEGCLEAIALLARTEGIFLDHVYTGKTMAALLDYIKKGVVRPADRVLFWHTGGATGIFAREWR